MKSLILVFLVFATAVAAAEPYAVGDRIEPFRLSDQHGVEHDVNAEVRVILFSRDMDGGDHLKQALKDVEEGWLQSRGGVYVADISGMPTVIAKMFALPSMRRRPYAMLLDRDGAATDRLPDVEGKATLIFCDRLAIERIEHLDSAEAVRAALGL